MPINPYEDSLELRVLSATPLELVAMLYESATEAVRSARRHLASGEISARSRAITKAVNILMELDSELDHKRGGDLSVRLAGLYGYMRKTLLEANFHQTEEGLITVEKLLASLGEAWAQIGTRQLEDAAPAAPPFAFGADIQTQSRQWSA